MKDKDQEGKTTNKLGSLCSTFGLLLSVMCCIALIHVEIRIQEQHRLISHSVRSCDQLETKILRKVQRNNARWQLEQYTINEGHLQHSGGYGDNISRKKRASDNSMKQTSLLTVSEIKLLVKQELGLLQNQICAKDKTLCQTGAKGNEGRRGRPGIRGKPGSPGKQGPPGKLGPEGPPGKHGPMGPQGTIGIKGDLGEPGVRGPLGQTGPPGNKGAKGEPGQSIAGIKGDLGEPGEPGPEGPTGPPGLKGVKGEPGQSLSAPSLLHSPVRTTVNQSQTVTLKCTADGNPAPKITWSKLNSSLPVGRHVVKPSGALIIKDARPDDEGVYSCRAESVLGRVNVSAKLTVQFAPLILLSSKTLWAEEEQNVTIACNTTGRPQPTITWSKAVGRLPTEKTKVKRGTLTIYTVEKTDRGTYICKAENILGSITASTQLTIVSRLQFKVRPPQAVTPASFGSTVQLPCLAESDLRTTVTWTKDGKSSLPDGSHILSNGTLLLQNIKKEHKGTYTCSAANELSTIEANIRVNTPLGPAKSCSEIQKFINNASGNYIIDPDGTGGLAPFTVYCDTTDKNGVGVTVISHDSETRTLVTGCYSQGCYSRDIHYTGASLSQLASLTRVSSQCEQFIRYECYDSVLLYNNNPYGWWVSRDSTKMRYWGGASVNGKCACGMTNSCANPNYDCNCDKQDTVWREDSGMLTDKARLPVKQLRFGDIGGRDKGYHTLGKLKCYGSS